MVYQRLTRIRNLPLRVILVVPFVLQVVAAVGVTGVWSIRNGQRTIHSLVAQIQTEVSDRVQTHIRDFLATPTQINQLAASALRTGQLDPDRPDTLERYFIELHHLFKQRKFNHISFGSQAGNYVAVRVNRQETGFEILRTDATTGHHLYRYQADAQGDRLSVPPVDRQAYDPRQREWYRDAIAAGQPTWTRIYRYFNAPTLGISHVYPYYQSSAQSQRQLVGVFATDLDLWDISHFLHNLKISNTGIGFILDAEGKLVASSTLDDLFVVHQHQTERILAAQSPNPLIVGVAEYLQQSTPNLRQITDPHTAQIDLHGQDQFLQIMPINGPQSDPWFLVVVIPETDFVSQTEANQRTTLILCLGVLLITSGFSVVVYRWIGQRVHRLSLATQALVAPDPNSETPQPLVEPNGITEFDTLTQAIHQIRQRLDEFDELGHLVEAMCEVIMVYDRQGRCLKIAPTNPKLLIAPPEHQVGKTLYDILPEPLAAFQLAQIRQVLDTKRTLQNLEYSLFIGGKEVWFSAIISPLSDTTVVWVARDISERKQAEAERQASEEKFATVFHASPNLIAMTTYLDGPFVEVNSGFLETSGYSSEEVLGKTAMDLNLWVDLAARQEMFDLLTRYGAFSNREYEFRSKVGEVRTGLLSAEVVEVNNCHYVLYVVNDITDRKRMEEHLRSERETSERLLRNILPSAIADQLKQTHRLTPASPEESFIAEQFEDVSILFADIVGFTKLSSSVSPKDLVNLLNRIFSAFDQLTERYGLEKIKTIGDSYMVAGGLPYPRPDHAEAIAKMALDMQTAIAQLRQESDYNLAIRIGINTGSVVAGVIGRKKFAYDLWGDTVNVAHRMESLGEPGRIQVTRATYERLKERYTLHQRPELLQVKGKGAMQTFWLTGERTSHPLSALA